MVVTTAAGPPQQVAALPPSDAALDEDTARRLHIDLNQTRGYNHWTRNVLFNPAGTKLYVTVGSSTNATPETDPKLRLLREVLESSPAEKIAVFPPGLSRPTKARICA